MELDGLERQGSLLHDRTSSSVTRGLLSLRVSVSYPGRATQALRSYSFRIIFLD